jgi:hypothetical protein
MTIADINSGETVFHIDQFTVNNYLARKNNFSRASKRKDVAGRSGLQNFVETIELNLNFEGVTNIIVVALTSTFATGAAEWPVVDLNVELFKHQHKVQGGISKFASFQ